jgi:hypothetical protein
VSDLVARLREMADTLGIAIAFDDAATLREAADALASRSAQMPSGRWSSITTPMGFALVMREKVACEHD